MKIELYISEEAIKEADRLYNLWHLAVEAGGIDEMKTARRNFEKAAAKIYHSVSVSHKLAKESENEADKSGE